ncbi:MAG: acyltransferase [Ginsengibacter sp.]
MHLKERFQNNYDFLRVFAAFCIIFFHSFALVGKSNEDPLTRISGDRINFAFIGLSIFFCISGFLIAKSAVKSPTLVNYLWKRLLRIQPLLAATCLFTIFLVGPFFTELSLKEYLGNSQTYTYFRNILPVFGIQFTLPGVFIHHLGDHGVNGSFWTLIIEERMYLLMTVIFLYRKDKSNYFIFLIVLLNVLYIINRYFFYGEMLPYLSGSAFLYSLMFLNSASLYLLKFRFGKNQVFIITVAFICFLVGIVFPKIDMIYFFALPVLVNAVAKIKGKLNYAGKYGDFTYGTYVFSFPVQQMLIAKGLINPYYIFMITTIIVFPLAILSWKYIEHPFLKLKHKVK